MHFEARLIELSVDRHAFRGIPLLPHLAPWEPRNKGFAVHAHREERLMNQGFTLIELVVVICIVAVTVSLVLPRVWFWQRQARIGHLNFARGAVHSSATLVHSAMLLHNGQPDTTPCADGGVADNRSEGRGTVCTEHGLAQTRNGYPASVAPGATDAPGILGAAGLGTSYKASAADLRAEGYDVRVANGVTTISRADAPVPAQCFFSYTESLVARTAASISPSVITGC
jgi:prepilin-type N-terminal cleavage/methylation domain-containing protein